MIATILLSKLSCNNAKDIDASVTVPVITEIELGTDVFKKMPPDKLSDIVYLAKLLRDSNDRIPRLKELNAPYILVASECAHLCKKVSALKTTHTCRPPPKT